MPISDLMTTGVELMLLGMGIVFGFLILLVFTLKLMSWLATRLLSPEPAVTPPAGNQVDVADSTLIAVISAAIARYRGDTKGR